MATFYLILVVILFFLAISDLVVGVSNDAVNFLNSAVGAKAASFKIIMLVAALGVLAGATFSSGMMEVARKGIFHPEFFYFSEIIILFLAVMVTDVILLDTFNTYGMPTSTTVSIVFELLGAAVAISLIKIFTDPDSLQLYEYINSAKALAIISGILLSVIVAFTCGMIAQYLSRVLFSFDYEKRMRKYGAFWGGLGIMAITYFMLIKGAKGASFMSSDLVASIGENTSKILAVSFVAWSAILYFLNRIFKVDILKVLVLVGTFALAMAFAGNDLVNFIGVPLAGFNSYQLYVESGAGGADQFLMDGLAGKVPTPTLLLLLAGVIMVITLYTSKKAKSVVKTSLDLGRQDEGYERFSSYMLSRSIVRNFATMATFVNDKLPSSWQNSVSQQFDQTPFTRKQVSLGAEAPAFDMIRASVTLVIASILIAIGTSLKLPLSTTYVTFMVFMGTSLADGAWGRESAVYRVSGVLSVIGGWFFTAFSAFIVAFILATIFHFGGITAISIILIIASVVIYRTHRTHSSKLKEQLEFDASLQEGTLSKAKVISLCLAQLELFLDKFGELVDQCLHALGKEDLPTLNKIYQKFRPIRAKSEDLKNHSSNALDRVPDHELEAGHLYILVVDYLNEMAAQVNTLIKSSLDHVDNNHKPFLPVQIEELTSLHNVLIEQYAHIIQLFRDLEGESVQTGLKNLKEFVRKTREVRKSQIRRIKNREVGTRNSVLFLNILGEFRNLELFASRIIRVFDELILNPLEETVVKASTIREELKEIEEGLVDSEEQAIAKSLSKDPDEGSDPEPAQPDKDTEETPEKEEDKGKDKDKNKYKDKAKTKEPKDKEPKDKEPRE